MPGLHQGIVQLCCRFSRARVLCLTCKCTISTHSPQSRRFATLAIATAILQCLRHRMSLAAPADETYCAIEEKSGLAYVLKS